ncbi:MAG: CpXC domain-containing protein [Lachnospiraceae bacterium]|nr:CpXC domain-containing protein [Lachnospiraceae bacterium]
MSKVHMEKVRCISCGEESGFKFYDMIDPMFSKETKDKVLSGEIFTFTCPHCGAKRRITYDTIYQEIGKGWYFHLVTSEDAYVQAINVYADRDAHSGTVLASEIVRIVLSQNQLSETIRIFDEGLDDRVVEIIKAYYLSEIQKQMPQLQIAESLFYVNENGQYEIAFLCTDGNHLTVNFSREMYDGIYQDIGVKLPPINQEIEVDMEIAMEYLERL